MTVRAAACACVMMWTAACTPVEPPGTANNAKRAPQTLRTWADLVAGTLTFSETNATKASEKWGVSIAAVPIEPHALPALIADPAQRDVKAETAADFPIRLADGAKIPPGVVGHYVITLSRTVGTTTTTTRTPLEIGPATPLAPQSGSKTVLRASRKTPFHHWEIRTPLVLTQGTDVSSLSGRPLGTLGTSNGAAAADISTVVRVAPTTNEASTTILPLAADLPRTWSGKLGGTLVLPDEQTREVVLETQDWPLYPLLTIAIGVLCAFGVKHYVTRGRVLRMLRTTLDDTKRRLASADKEIETSGASGLVAGYDIAAAWTRFRTDIESDIALLGLSGQPLDQNNAALTAVTRKIDAARALPGSWRAMPAAVRQVREEASRLRQVPPPDGAAVPDPLLADALEETARARAFSTIESVSEKATQLGASGALGATWRATWERIDRLRGLFSGDRRPALDAVRLELWESANAPAVKAVSDAVDRLVADLGRPSLTQAPMVVTQRESGVAGTAVAFSPAAVSIRRNDALVTGVAITAAVLGGMNTLVFGKPFGSIGDYSAVLVWALTASIVVDVASLALERLAGGISRSARP